ncbi:MAG: lipid-A-disaccharide synthase [Pseudolabrys sp.]|nr:lipid-A-disaccharide synthase [Pseudolabrys sp.]
MTASPPLHVYLVAAEESGDRLGAALMRALKTRAGTTIRFAGVGGHHMAAEGLALRLSTGDLAVTGFVSLFGVLFRALKLIRDTANDIAAQRPDVLVIIDSPEFTLRVAKRLRAIAPQIPIVEYVSPSVWAWRPWRARAMRGYIDRVMALLPFEPDVHKRLGGPACTFVGHPLADQVDTLRPREGEAARRNETPPIVLLMPGSRRSELDRMLDLFEGVAQQIEQRTGPAEFVMPAVPSVAARLRAAVAKWPTPVRIVESAAEKQAAFHAARAAIVKSGTGTLELALAGIPMVALYKVSAIEAVIFRRLISAPSAILTNLILGENAVPEFLQEDATVEKIVEAALPLLGDTPQRRAQLQAFRRLDAVMEIGKVSPSDRAAAIVMEMAKRNAG